MGFLPVIRASRLIPVLVRAGFRIMRQAGSHVHLERVLNKVHKVTVPMHNNRPRSKLRGIPEGIRVLQSDDNVGVISSASSRCERDSAPGWHSSPRQAAGYSARDKKDLPSKTLLSILKQAGISIKEFLKLIGRK